MVKKTGDAGSVLLAYIEGQPEPPDFHNVDELINTLRSSHEWSKSIPELVNEGVDEYRTLGVLLRLPASSNDIATERLALADVEHFVEAIEMSTMSWAAEFAFELDGEVVGWVAAGERDQLLREGLLVPWHEQLAEWSESPG